MIWLRILLISYLLGSIVDYVVVQTHFNAPACHNLGQELKKKPLILFVFPGWFLACGEALDL